MQLTQIEFGSLLSYCPRGDSEPILRAREVRNVLKADGFVNNSSGSGQPISMSEWVAHTMSQFRTRLPFSGFFAADSILVPTPSSSLLQPDSLWVPERVANALVKYGFGKEVVSCLKRTSAVRKAAYSRAEDRTKPVEHYQSMGVQGSLNSANEIVLVDDIVTRGATLLGAANRLHDVFPAAKIRAFAVMRTISDPSEFRAFYDPRIGTITYREEQGDTIRRP